MSSVQAGRTVTGPLVLVNADHPLSPAPPPDLLPPDPLRPEVLMERRASHLLRACLQSIGGMGAILPVSGWRSREEQQAIWDDTMAREGAEFTRSYVARPGCSEHQTGLAVDLAQAAPHIDFIRPHFPHTGVCGTFRRRAADYGFIERYPAGKEAVTGIAHEPWHFRYVGVPHAGIMASRGLVLEEYLALLREEHVERPLTYRSDFRTFQIRYCPAGELGPVPFEGEGYRQISGDNCGGLVVTIWR